MKLNVLGLDANITKKVSGYCQKLLLALLNPLSLRDIPLSGGISALLGPGQKFFEPFGLSSPEDHRADADHGGAFFDGYRVVAGHSHGDFVAICVDVTAFADPVLEHI